MNKLVQQITKSLRDRPEVDDTFEQRTLAGARRRMSRGGRQPLWLAATTAAVAAIVLWGVMRGERSPNAPGSSVPTNNESLAEPARTNAVLRLLELSDTEASLRDGADWAEIEKPLWQSLSKLGEER